MPDFHYFQPDIAAQYGINAAILLQNFAFWIEKNRANGKHCHDGLYWTYNSVRAFKELFPYMSAKSVRTAIKKLVDEGLLLTGNFNASAYDRTTWYAVTEKGNSILQNRDFHLPERQNGFTEKGEPIPDNKPDINTDNKPDNIIAQAPDFENQRLQTALENWLAYKREKRQPYKEQGRKSLVTQIRNNAERYGADSVVALIEECMAANYQGIIWEKLKRREKETGWDFRDLG